MATGSVDMEGCGVKRRSARAHAVQVDGPLLLTETGRSSFIARQIQTLIIARGIGWAWRRWGLFVVSFCSLSNHMPRAAVLAGGSCQKQAGI